MKWYVVSLTVEMNGKYVRCRFKVWEESEEAAKMFIVKSIPFKIMLETPIMVWEAKAQLMLVGRCSAGSSSTSPPFCFSWG